MTEIKSKDELVGSAKEAAGAILDDDSLRIEGRVDQIAGKVKKKAGEMVDRVRDAIDSDDSDEDSSKQS